MERAAPTRTVEEVLPAVAFEDFFRSEYPTLARALLLLVGDRGEAEDLAQEAMARTYERWERVRDMDSPTGYVYRAALNLHRKHLRRLAVRARRVFTGSPEPDPAEAAGAAVDVRRALVQLPPGQREALVLVGWLGMTADEAGRALGIDPASVRGRLFGGSFEFPGNRIQALAPSGRAAWAILDAAARRVEVDPPNVEPERRGPSRIEEVPQVSDALVADGLLWIVAGEGKGPWDLRAYDLSTGEPAGASLTLGSGEGPRIASGGGFLWVTDPAGEGVIAVDPTGTTFPDPEPRLTEEPDPEGGCPPPDLEATWFPPGLSPMTPQRGLGGGADVDDLVTRAVHYGDSPGPDGRPAPLITIIRTNQHGGPHINAATATEIGTPVRVLDGEGYLVRIEGGWGAFFLHGEPPCHGYEVTSYGVSRADLRRFLEGLSVPPRDYLLVQPRDGLTSVYPRGWDTVEVLTERSLRVRFLARREECNALDRVEVRETHRMVAITLFEGWRPGVESCHDAGGWKAVDVTLEAPLGGREIVDGSAEGG